MPIRINLLAEAQAAEELRRRDPVKRAMWVSAFLIFVMLAWSSSLQMKAIMARGELGRVEAQLSTRSNDFRSVLDQQRQLTTVELKLRSLEKLASTRMLNGNMLNALQQSMVADVELVRVKADQSYLFTQAVKPKTNSDSRVIAGKPATVTEKTLITIDARDAGPVPGDQVNKYRGAIAGFPYFKQALATNELRLANLSPPQVSPDSKAFVLFTLECRYPEVTR